MNVSEPRETIAERELRGLFADMRASEKWAPFIAQARFGYQTPASTVLTVNPPAMLWALAIRLRVEHD